MKIEVGKVLRTKVRIVCYTKNDEDSSWLPEGSIIVITAIDGEPSYGRYRFVDKDGIHRYT